MKILLNNNFPISAQPAIRMERGEQRDCVGGGAEHDQHHQVLLRGLRVQCGQRGGQMASHTGHHS